MPPSSRKALAGAGRITIANRRGHASARNRQDAFRRAIPACKCLASIFLEANTNRLLGRLFRHELSFFADGTPRFFKRGGVGPLRRLLLSDSRKNVQDSL